MKALIMAAGEGKRLSPFTQTTPKVLLQIAGKPIIHHLILEAKKAGIKEAVIVVRYLKEKIIEYFKNNDPGIKLTFVEQIPENGTGSAILSAENEFSDTFVVLAGDTVTESSIIQSVIEEHKKGITLAVKKVPNPREYGVVELSNGKISAFEEKPQNPKTDLANLSIYCMEPTIFSDLRRIGKSSRNEYEVVNLFVGAKAVVTTGMWKDIGYPWDLFDANEMLLNKLEQRNQGSIENSTIKGKVILEKGAQIINSYVEDYSYIGENTIIGPNSHLRGFNSIGKNCSIGSGSCVKNSILFDNVHAKHLTYIGDSVIGSDVNFGAGTQIANYRFDGSVVNVFTERGWTNTAKRKIGAFVGDGTKFGVLSCTMPGKIIGSNCQIHSGVIINQNIPPNTIVSNKQDLIITKI